MHKTKRQTISKPQTTTTFGKQTFFRTCTKITGYISLCYLLLCTANAHAYSSTLNTDNLPTQAQRGTIQTDNQGVLHLAYYSRADKQLNVYQYINNRFELRGNQAITTTPATHLQLTFDNNNTPYITARVRDQKQRKARIFTLQNDQRVALGDNQGNISHHTNPTSLQMAILQGTEPIVWYKVGKDTVRLYQRNNNQRNTWQTLQSNTLSLTHDQGGNIRYAIEHNNETKKGKTKKTTIIYQHDGEQQTQKGQVLPYSYGKKLYIDHQNQPRLLSTENKTKTLTLRRYNTSTDTRNIQVTPTRKNYKNPNLTIQDNHIHMIAQQTQKPSPYQAFFNEGDDTRTTTRTDPKPLTPRAITNDGTDTFLMTMPNKNTQPIIYTTDNVPPIIEEDIPAICGDGTITKIQTQQHTFQDRSLANTTITKGQWSHIKTNILAKNKNKKGHGGNGPYQQIVLAQNNKKPTTVQAIITHPQSRFVPSQGNITNINISYAAYNGQKTTRKNNYHYFKKRRLYNTDAIAIKRAAFITQGNISLQACNLNTDTQWRKTIQCNITAEQLTNHWFDLQSNTQPIKVHRQAQTHSRYRALQAGIDSLHTTFHYTTTKQQNEQCDDGNTIDGDGCSSSCQKEFGYQCKQQPSVCACSIDSDHDSLTDCQEGNTPDTDNDGLPDYLDPDDDGDGIPTHAELAITTANNSDTDNNDDGTDDNLQDYVATLNIQSTGIQNTDTIAIFEANELVNGNRTNNTCTIRQVANIKPNIVAGENLIRNIKLKYNMFDFEVIDCQGIEAKRTLQGATDMSNYTYVKYATGVWRYTFTGATFGFEETNGQTTPTVTLKIPDNGLGDECPEVGVICDPGGPLECVDEDEDGTTICGPDQLIETTNDNDCDDNNPTRISNCGASGSGQSTVSITGGSITLSPVCNVDFGDITMQAGSQSIQTVFPCPIQVLDHKPNADVSWTLTMAMDQLDAGIDQFGNPRILGDNNLSIHTLDYSQLTSATAQGSQTANSRIQKVPHTHWGSTFNNGNTHTLAYKTTGEQNYQVGSYHIDNLQIQLTIPSHTAPGTYTGGITFTLTED